MSKPFGKIPNNWLQLPSTASFLNSLINVRKSHIIDYQPVRTYQGLPKYGGGTWFKEDVIIEYVNLTYASA